MDEKLEITYRVLKRAVQQINNSIFVPLTSTASDVFEGPSESEEPEDVDDDCLVLYDSHNRANIKRPKLDNSNNSENLNCMYKQPECSMHLKKNLHKKKSDKTKEVSCNDNSQPEINTSTSSTLLNPVVDSGFAENSSEVNIEQLKNNESCDGQTESNKSDSSTYFSPAEDDDCENSPKRVRVENLPTQKKISGESLNTSINIWNNNNLTLYYIRLFFEVLEDSFTQCFEPMNNYRRWRISRTKEVVDVFVQLAESNNAEARRQCKTEVVKSLGKFYELFLKSSKSQVPFEDTQWCTAFSIVQTLCNSKNICAEFIKFFDDHSKMTQITKDLEDPKEIIESLIQHRTARFGSLQWQYATEKYTTFVED